MNYLITLLAKIIYFVSKTFKLGSGYTWPGHFALLLKPNLLKSKYFLPSKGVVFITGTNGKTTTSKLITHILKNNGYKVVSNRSGANLVNGVVSELLLNTDALGIPKYDFGVFEVDEFALVNLLKMFPPNILVLLNLSRDQLDRYGEIDIIYDRWKDVFRELKDTLFIADISQEMFKDLSILLGSQVKYFHKEKEMPKGLGLMGDFNKKNLGAAFTVCESLGIDRDTCLNSLTGFNAAYGRGESIIHDKNNYRVFLAKNPASFNNNLDLVTENLNEINTLLFALNDNIPDGRDVSWIYDIEPDKLCEVCQGKNLYVTGTRAYDMVVRLKYAGCTIQEENINLSLVETIKKINLASTNRDIVALPNYSAMLELRGILTGKKIL